MLRESLDPVIALHGHITHNVYSSTTVLMCFSRGKHIFSMMLPYLKMIIASHGSGFMNTR